MQLLVKCIIYGTLLIIFQERPEKTTIFLKCYMLSNNSSPP